MIEPTAVQHATLSLWLDAADKLIKAAAVVIGGFWTFWNYKKSRPYARKLELALGGAVFGRRQLFIDITATLKNVGASRQSLDQQGTFCELVAVFTDLREELVSVFPVFQERTHIEPNEAITDRLQWRIDTHPNEVVWFKLRLRVVSEGLEWNRQELIRAKEEDTWSTALGL